MRPWMIERRKEMGLTVKQMAEKCECGYVLLNWLENNKNIITHPDIASRIAAEYKLTVEQYNTLVAAFRKKTKLPKRVAPPYSAPQFFPEE